MERLRTFFMLRWTRCSFHKKHTGTHYAKLVYLHPVGSAGHIVHSSASGPRNIDALFFLLRWGRCGFRKKACCDTLRRTCVFVSGGICGSHSAFQCIWAVKRGHTIFHAQVDSVQFP
jgi:hypothetical protein